MINLTNEDIERLHQAKAIMEKEFRYHYLVDQLASKVGLNDNKFKIGFRRLFQTTPYNYLSTVRLEKAKDLLVNTDLPIKRVAGIVGVNDKANFVRWFKRMTGSAPTDWRRNYQKAGIKTIS